MKGLSLCLLVVFFYSHSANAENCGLISKVVGQVEVLRVKVGDGNVRQGMKVTKPTPIECSDVVLSGKSSSAILILANSKLALGPDSRIELSKVVHEENKTAAIVKDKKMSKVNLVQLSYGMVRTLFTGVSKVTGAGKVEQVPSEPVAPEDFKVKTFSAVVGVRGTDFFTRYDPNNGNTEQATIHGKVEVSRNGSKQKAIVTAGQFVAVEPSAAVLKEASQGKASKGSGSDQIMDGGEAPKDVNQGSETTGEKSTVGPSEETEDEKPLVVQAIGEAIRNDLRIVSAVAKDEPEFTTKAAVAVIGDPKTWTIQKEPVPKNLKDIKNEF